MKSPVYPIIAEGKTKIIASLPDEPHAVLIFSKNDITAGDGAKRDHLPDKGLYANETTCNCFMLLKTQGIMSHFIKRNNGTSFKARRLRMIPLELVARRIATGSFLKRRPDVAEGARFDQLVIEFFEKDDVHHDPLVIFDFASQHVLRYAASQPLPIGFHSETPFALDRLTTLQASGLDNDWYDMFFVLRGIIHETFLILESVWAKQNIVLVDLKVECGLTHDDDPDCPGEVFLGDVIDNDSWRLWPEGKKEMMLDKQVYRNLPVSTPDALRQIIANYAAVAQATNRFFD